MVLSSSIIPGNEKGIFRVIDHLSRREANVIYDDGQHGLIHVSGHGSQEEMRLLINLVRPKFFIPMHGDYRFLRRHAQVAMETGAVEHAIVIEDGDVLELDKDDARKQDKVTAGRILIDSGSSIDVVEDLVIRDRRILSEDGVVLAVLAINKKTGKVEREPEVVMRGFGGADITDAGARNGAEDAGRPERRAEVRLRHGERTGARGAEAADPEEHRAAADDHAGDPGDLKSRDQGPREQG